MFYIHVLDEIYAYKVDQIDIILPDEISLYLQMEKDLSRVFYAENI